MIYIVSNSKEVRVVGVEFLKGKIVGGGLERWVGVGIVVNTDGIGFCELLKDFGFDYKRWRVIVGV